MLKIEHSASTVNRAARLTCCFDVSKRSLSLYAEYQSEHPPSGLQACRIEDEIPNATAAIEPLLGRLDGLAEEAGLSGLTVLAEATGGYELGAPRDRVPPRP